MVGRKIVEIDSLFRVLGNSDLSSSFDKNKHGLPRDRRSPETSRRNGPSGTDSYSVLRTNPPLTGGRSHRKEVGGRLLPRR